MNLIPPWTATLTTAEFQLTLYFFVLAGLALLAGFMRSIVTQAEVGSRFRPAVVARLSITGIAFVSYIGLLLTLLLSYTHSGGAYSPTDSTVSLFALRYSDWSVTVPLLTFELLAVCTFTGAHLRRTQLLAGGFSFLMIFCGFMGAIIVDGGENRVSTLLWGGISVVFWIATNIVLIGAVQKSLPNVTPRAAVLLKNAAIVLLSGWVIYPIVFLIQIFGDGGAWATTMQIALCVADVVVKLGFGTLIHRVAKLRTAEDVRAGDDVHPESIWISSEKLSDAGQPLEVHLAKGAEVHPRHSRPPTSTAVPTVQDPEVVGDL
ncbi:bacteriorhodopsin [Subtercola sp. RTI3]|uniref:bacteriorhodopsin n=1 Tax=Subtercola sp. RTI3 TaxID=3048639 RepID=UPI002B22EB2F|nr:bacteriorhodopsin [Subtercola sp. RTI3]MEA9985552.1 bacteriorhodopsin [Subtercola sp. RTI3]